MVMKKSLSYFRVCCLSSFFLLSAADSERHVVREKLTWPESALVSSVFVNGFLCYLYVLYKKTENINALKKQNADEEGYFMGNETLLYGARMFEQYPDGPHTYYTTSPVNNPSSEYGFCSKSSKNNWKKLKERDFQKGTCPKNYWRKNHKPKFKGSYR